MASEALALQFRGVVAGFFMLFVFLIVVGSAAQWWQLIRGTKPVVLRESEFVPVTQLEAISS